MTLAVVALVLLSTAGQIVGFYTDWLWFHEMRFTSVFVTVLQTQVLLGLIMGAALFPDPLRQREPCPTASPRARFSWRRTTPSGSRVQNS